MLTATGGAPRHYDTRTPEQETAALLLERALWHHWIMEQRWRNRARMLRAWIHGGGHRSWGRLRQDALEERQALEAADRHLAERMRLARWEVV